MGNEVSTSLVSLIPKAAISCLCGQSHGRPYADSDLRAPADCVLILACGETDAGTAVKLASGLREKAIELGKNFVSVNLTKDRSMMEHAGPVDWGTNHLELNTTHLSTAKAADKIFKWLCKRSHPWHGGCVFQPAASQYISFH